VRFVFCALASHGYFDSWHRQIDLHIERRAVVTMCWRRFDDYMTAGDPIVKAFETLDMLSHARLDGGRSSHVAKGNSQGCLHGCSQCL
jgi:hypothetical protein